MGWFIFPLSVRRVALFFVCLLEVLGRGKKEVREGPRQRHFWPSCRVSAPPASVVGGAVVVGDVKDPPSLGTKASSPVVLIV
jgi:hypothetical protein